MKQLEQAYGSDHMEALFKRMQTHEQVVFCNDPATGLQAIIAIHDTTLGPALGGTRMYPYASVEAALDDVLRLSEGMTFKCAAADIDFGGAKGVIIGDPKTDKTPGMFRAYGQFVESLNGRFYTGTDMGTTMDDFVHAAKETNFINGLPEVYGGGGDSSIPTARGVVYGLRATNQFLFGSDTFVNHSYALQGLGKVGFKVAEHLLEAGATVYVTDIRNESIKQIQDLGKMTPGTVYAVDQNEIFDVDADVFVPCALGGILNDKTIPRLKTKAVVGSANNQLEEKRHVNDLERKGILYAPDFIVNSGGLIQVADELYSPNAQRVLAKTEAIYDQLSAIYETADRKGITTNEAADLKVRQRLTEQVERNSFFNRSRSPKWTVKE